MHIDPSLLGWIENRPELIALVAGAVTALIVYGLVQRGARRRRRAFRENARKFHFFRLTSFFLGQHTAVLPGMDALSNTPDAERTALEKRSTFRRRDRVVEAWLASEPGAEPELAWIVDRSTTGLGVLLKRELPPGSIVGIRAVSAPATAPWVDVEIRSCALQGKRWRLGCKFLATPDWGLLLMFG